MSACKADYPLVARTDAATAMARALASYIRDLRFAAPVEPWQFQRVHVRWAPFWKAARGDGGAVAAVLADAPRYEPIGMTPRLLERTWSGGDPRECGSDGKPYYPLGDGSGIGLALVEGDECVVSMSVHHRTISSLHRISAFRVLEQIFMEDETLIDSAYLDPRIPRRSQQGAPAQPTRNGRVLPLRDYYDRNAVFTLKGATLESDATSAKENRWIGTLEVEGRVGVCTLREVRGMSVRTRILVDGAPASS